MPNAERRQELIDVVEALAPTFGRVTKEGFLIDRVHAGPITYGIQYSDPGNPDGYGRTMSGAAYAAEFMKVCGLSLDEVDFTEMVSDCLYVGNILGAEVLPELDSGGIESLRIIARGKG